MHPYSCVLFLFYIWSTKDICSKRRLCSCWHFCRLFPVKRGWRRNPPHNSSQTPGCSREKGEVVSGWGRGGGGHEYTLNLAGYATDWETYQNYVRCNYCNSQFSDTNYWHITDTLINWHVNDLHDAPAVSWHVAASQHTSSHWSA